MEDRIGLGHSVGWYQDEAGSLENEFGLEHLVDWCPSENCSMEDCSLLDVKE